VISVAQHYRFLEDNKYQKEQGIMLPKILAFSLLPALLPIHLL
jgi:hypothetical protein